MDPKQQPFARFGTSCENSALNFSDFPTIDNSFLSNYQESIHCGLRLPLDVTDGVVLKFAIGESKGLWLDPMQTAIHMQFQAVDENGKFLPKKPVTYV